MAGTVQANTNKVRSRWTAVWLGVLVAVGLTACASPPPETQDIRFERVRFSDLPGWQNDDHAAALSVLHRSCPNLRASGTGRHGTIADWRRICDQLETIGSSEARSFLERNFEPFRVTAPDGNDKGLITGYFEPELRGSRQPGSRFDTPLYRRPPELVSVELGEFREEYRGETITGHIVAGRLRPYFDRRDLDRGALEGRGLELVWVDSAVDAFFLHIQGSGRVRLRDGTVIRLGYDGTNGQPYRAIGRDLIHRGEIPREHVSMQSIRKWLTDNPGSATELMWANRSYIFFRILEGEGPIGTAGLPLRPGRSLAVDQRLVPLGLPVWIDTYLPDDEQTPLRRLTIAQDTGGAIRGPVRADLFWGSGDRAADIAGQMKSSLRYWILSPTSALSIAGRSGVPLSPSRSR